MTILYRMKNPHTNQYFCKSADLYPAGTVRRAVFSPSTEKAGSRPSKKLYPAVPGAHRGVHRGQPALERPALRRGRADVLNLKSFGPAETFCLFCRL